MSISPTQIILILAIILLLFGAKKLPELARSVGRSARIFKSEMKEMGNDEDTNTQQQSADSQQQALNSGQAQAQQSQQAQTASKPNADPSEDFWNKPENQPRSNS